MGYLELLVQWPMSICYHKFRVALSPQKEKKYMFLILYLVKVMVDATFLPTIFRVPLNSAPVIWQKLLLFLKKIVSMNNKNLLISVVPEKSSRERHHITFLSRFDCPSVKWGLWVTLKRMLAGHSRMHCADGKFDSLLHMALLQRMGVGNNYSESLQAWA